MDNSQIDLDENSERVEEILQNESIEYNGQQVSLGQLMGDIKEAHRELDEYKKGALSMSQSISEAKTTANDEILETILEDMYEASFGVYLRLQRGDKELTGDRNGEYSGYLTE